MLPEITDEELEIYHIDQEHEIALAMYIERTGLTIRDTNIMMISEMFEWEWHKRLYDEGEP